MTRSMIWLVESGPAVVLSDSRTIHVWKRLGCAILRLMDELGMVVVWLIIITVGAIAGIVTDSPWGGIIVAALGLGLYGLLTVRRQPR